MPVRTCGADGIPQGGIQLLVWRNTDAFQDQEHKGTMQAEWPGADSTACIRIRRKYFGNPCVECGT